MSDKNPVQARLVEDRKTAMKAKAKERLAVIRLMLAELQSAQMNQSTDEMTEEQELDVLRKMVKNRRDAVEQAQQVGRQDIVDAESNEIEVILTYLPQMLTGDELLTRVKEVAAEIEYSGPADKGKFMKTWMSRFKGQAEGRDVQDALGQLG
ncbi:MAG: GatB/YqeY domain-containing protein [Planctomycetota bacterium]